MKFLGQAKKFFKVLGTEPQAKPQQFNVRCISGHRVRGERTEGYQALRCPACGEGVFVLPRSPLPIPSAPQRSTAPRAARALDRLVDEGPVELTDPARVSVEIGGDEDVAADADIIWDDPPPQPVPQVARKKPRAPAPAVDLGVAGPPGAAPKESGQAAPRSPGQVERVGRDRVREPERRASHNETGRHGAHAASPEDRRAARPHPVMAGAGRHANDDSGPEVVHEIKPARPMQTLHRWLLVLVPLLVIGTVAWRYRENRRQEYPLIVEKGRTEGIEALEEGNFVKAHRLLSAAKSAVDALGGAVNDADDIRDAAAEASIFVDLVTEDLGDLLEKANRLGDHWESEFDKLYKGRSIFIDSVITEVPDGTNSSRFELQFRILPPGVANSFRDRGEPDLIGEIDLTGFKLFEKVELGNQVIFGARLLSFKPDKSDDKKWLVRLEPNSGVFITHTKALDALDWRRDAPPPAPEQKEDQP